MFNLFDKFKSFCLVCLFFYFILIFLVKRVKFMDNIKSNVKFIKHDREIMAFVWNVDKKTYDKNCLGNYCALFKVEK